MNDKIKKKFEEIYPTLCPELWLSDGGFWSTGYNAGAESRQQEIDELSRKLQTAENIAMEQAIKIANMKADRAELMGFPQKIAQIINEEDLKANNNGYITKTAMMGILRKIAETADLYVTRMEAKNEKDS